MVGEETGVMVGVSEWVVEEGGCVFMRYVGWNYVLSILIILVLCKSGMLPLCARCLGRPTLT